jgi:hypothetical protein
MWTDSIDSPIYISLKTEYSDSNSDYLLSPPLSFGAAWRPIGKQRKDPGDDHAKHVAPGNIRNNCTLKPFNSSDTL